MSVGEKILKHRKELNLTQQQLGKMVGVSAKTVSKWENNTTFPNALSIVPLARVLHISTDKLLCFNDRRNEFELMWQETLKKHGDDPQKTLPISVSALDEYPFDKQFLFRAAIDEERLADLETDDKSKSARLHRAMGYAQRLLKEDPQRETAKQVMVRIYSKLGLEDMAIEQANKCENVDLALKFCLKGDSLRRHRQIIIDKKLHELLYEMSIQDLNMLDVCEKIVNIVIPDGNYQYYYHILAGVYLKRANIYIQTGDEKAAIDSLRKLFEIAKMTADISKAQKSFTAPLLNLLEDNTPFCEQIGYVELFLLSMKREFACLENNEDVIKILNDATIYISDKV